MVSLTPVAMSDQKRNTLPIGYWLRRADELLTARIGEAQHDNGLSRLDWQALNVVHDAGSPNAGHVASTLSPFASAVEGSNVLRSLAGRGLVHQKASGEYELTTAGSLLYEKALSAQKEVRFQATLGIGEDEYRATVTVLQRLVKNLEHDDAT